MVMAIKVLCPLCENMKLTEDELDAIDNGEMEAPIIEFIDAEEYAMHIIELHKSDIRCSWAVHYLENLEKQREAERLQEIEKQKQAEEKVRLETEAKNKPEFILGASPRELTQDEKINLIFSKLNQAPIDKPVEKPVEIPQTTKVKPKKNSKVFLITFGIIMIGIAAIIFIMYKR